MDPCLLVVQSAAVSLLQGDGLDHTRAEKNLSQLPVTSPRLSENITGGGNPFLDGWSLILGQQLLKIPVGHKVKTSSFNKEEDNSHNLIPNTFFSTLNTFHYQGWISRA